MSVDFIVNSKRPFPEWIRNHQVFKETNRIDKIFPKIGIPNFKEPCEIMNTTEAVSKATYLGARIIRDMGSAQRSLYDKLERALASTEKNRNELCCSIQSMISLIATLVYSMNSGDYVKTIDGKVSLKLRSDIFNGDKSPTFKKDESIPRIVGKVWEELEKVGVNLVKLDQLQEFKDFSRVNIPNKKYKVAFSSYGEDGIWDIATISMRGIVSCQAWNAPQSRGLIGSISSKFVGVIYVESEKDEVPGYGTKMLNRSMVRFAIHKTTKKPALLIDNMYPNPNVDTMNTFKKVLKDKSGLDVFATSENSAASNYYIPDEPSRRFLKQGEFSYMDSAIAVQEHRGLTSISSIPLNMKELTIAFKKDVEEDINKMVKAKRELYLAAEKRVAELRVGYDAAKAKWNEENAWLENWEPDEGEKPLPTPFEIVKPEIDPELAAFGKGGIMNLLSHIDKRQGKDLGGKVFAKLILDCIEVPDVVGCTSKEEYHRKYLMTFLRNPKVVKEEAHKKFAVGSWMKSFPKSGEKFFETIFSQMKGYFVANCKEMIKKAN